MAAILRRIRRPAWWALMAGVLLLLLAATGAPWWLGLAGLVALAPFGWAAYSALERADPDEPFPWPDDMRTAAQGMARPIDPNPASLLPPHEAASEIAKVETTKEGLDRLLTERPPLWRWALFTSGLVQRRNAAQRRLRNCALGYQPGPGTPLGGHAYSVLAYEAMHKVADLTQQMEQFMLSPGFTGALAVTVDENDADSDAILHVANRLMDYHESLLREAERCLQTPVESDAIVFVQDVGTVVMCPLVGYEQFVVTMCSRVAEGREILPYVEGVARLDDANLAMTLPDGLMARINRHVERFTP